MKKVFNSRTCLCIVGLLFSRVAVPSVMLELFVSVASCEAADELYTVDVEKVRDDIERYLQQAESKTNENKIRDARQILGLLNQKLELYKKKLSKPDRDAYRDRVNNLTSTMESHVDSLVAKNISILQHQGPQAAIEYRQLLMSRCGVSEADLAAVDEAIVTSGPVDDSRTSTSSSPQKMNEPVISATDDLEKREKATKSRRDESIRQEQARLEREKAELIRQDSIRAEYVRRDQIRMEERRKEIENQERERLENVKAEQERIKRQQAEQSRRERDNEERVQKERIRREHEQLERLKAEQLRLEASALQQAREDSVRQVQQRQELLRAEQQRRDRQRLETMRNDSLVRAQRLAREDSLKNARARADSALTTQTEKLRRLEEREVNIEKAESNARKIEQLLTENDPGEANMVFGIFEPSLRRFLDAATFERLRSSVEIAYAEYQKNHGWAEQISENIMTLVGQKKGGEAHALFTQNQAGLRKYLGKTIYTDLENSVATVYAEFTRQQTKASQSAAKIGTLLDSKKSEQAYAQFQQVQAHLSLYLGKESYDALERRVNSAYTAMQDKKKWAELYARDITGLIAQKRGNEANEKLQKEKSQLRRYLTQQTFVQLEASVAKAYTEYTKLQMQARSIAARVTEFLSQKKAELAYAEFSNNKDLLKKYLNPASAYEQLQNNVIAAYNFVLDQKKWAAQYIKSIYVLIDQKEGEAAYGRLLDGKAKLKEYAPITTIDSLEFMVEKARTDYQKNQARAQVTVSTISKLLLQKKVEEAYALFQQNKASLEHYLVDVKLFTDLATQVTDAYRQLVERKRWAELYLGEIALLIEQREGGRANEQFQKEKSALVEYGNPQTVRTLENASAKAAVEYRLNQEKAQTTASEIRNNIDAGKVDKAYQMFLVSKNDIRHYLNDVQAFEALQLAVEQAYRNVLEKRKWAVQQSRQISMLIRRGEGRQAYAMFEQYKTGLQQYLDRESYQTLESMVASANNEYLEGQTVAQNNASVIEEFLGRKSVEDAYTLFSESESDLQKYLSQPAFKSLKARVETQYDALQEKEKAALSDMRKISYLIKQQQGDEAHAVFQSRKTELEKYLDTQTYSILAKAVTQALSDYTRNRERMLILAERLRAASNRGSTEEAFMQLKSRRSELKQYLSEAEFVGLEAAILKPFETLMQHRKKARGELSEIQRLLNRNEVEQAYNNFYRIRARLKTYLTVSEFEEFDAMISAAYEKITVNNKTAIIMAESIYELLSSQLVDSAYSSLKGSKSFLKQNLDMPAYKNLEKEVEKQYAAFANERKDARAYEKQIYNLLGKGDLWPAYRNFRSKRAWLKTYLEPTAFEQLENRVAIAYNKGRKKKR